MTMLAVGFSYGFNEVQSKPKEGSDAKPTSGNVSIEPMLLAKASTLASAAKLKQKSNPELTPRTPYIKEANIDIFTPVRWDTTTNRVSCYTLYIGDPDGSNPSVGYIKFKPPTVGTYFIQTHFAGTKMTCNVQGPWGTATGSTLTLADSGLVTAVYTAQNTNPIEFSMHFSAQYGQGGGNARWLSTEFIKFNP
jgi:hypothetical protein